MGNDDDRAIPGCLLLTDRGGATPAAVQDLAPWAQALRDAGLPALIGLDLVAVAALAASERDAWRTVLDGHQLVWHLTTPLIPPDALPKRLGLALKAYSPMLAAGLETAESLGTRPIGCLPDWLPADGVVATDPAAGDDSPPIPSGLPPDPAFIRACADAALPWFLGAPFESDRPGESLYIGGLDFLRTHAQWPARPELPPDSQRYCLRLELSSLRDQSPSTVIDAVAQHFATLNLQPQSLPAASAAPAALSRHELIELAQRIGHRLHPLRAGDRWLSVADQFTLMVRATAAPADAPDSPVPLTPVHGPAVPPLQMDAVLVAREQLAAAAAALADDLAQTAAIPAIVPVGPWAVTPCAFLVGLADALRGDEPAIKIPAGPLPLYDATRKPARDYIAELGAPGAPAWLAASARCLFWTARPGR